MKCIVSGGTGFIGRHIVDRLRRDNNYVAVWSRKPGLERRTGVASHYWDPLAGEPPEESVNAMDIVVHLAGEPVAQRWNPAVKQRIRDSRVLGTRRLVSVIGRVPHKPKALICASAVGYYGSRGDEILTETSSPGTGFLADICKEWEAEAGKAREFGLRVMRMRIGFVLGNDGGALAQMLPVFRAGAGGRLGPGTQWMPWIHIDDVTELFAYAVENDVSGVWNATSPNPVRNSEFTDKLSHAVHRPALVPVPQFALKLAFGELAQHMLDSVRVMPDLAIKSGFRFQFPELGPALASLIR